MNLAAEFLGFQTGLAEAIQRDGESAAVTMTDDEIRMLVNCHAKQIEMLTGRGVGYREDLRPIADRLAELVAALPERPKSWIDTLQSNKSFAQSYGPFVVGAPR